MIISFAATAFVSESTTPVVKANEIPFTKCILPENSQLAPAPAVLPGIKIVIIGVSVPTVGEEEESYNFRYLGAALMLLKYHPVIKEGVVVTLVAFVEFADITL